MKGCKQSVLKNYIKFKSVVRAYVIINNLYIVDYGLIHSMYEFISESENLNLG